MNTWRTCQLQFYQIYGLGHQTPSGKAASLGTAIHKVLEILAICKKLIQDNPKKKKLTCVDPEVGSIDFTVKSLYTDEFVDSLIRLSYDHYTTHNPHLEYDPKKDYEFVKKYVYVALEYNGGQLDVRNLEIFEPEQNFNIEIDAPWANVDKNGEQFKLSIKGTMDLIVRENKQTLHLIDWKSGKFRTDFATGKVKNLEDFYSDEQLLLYYFAICSLYPETEYVIVTIVYLQAGGPFSMCFDRSHYDKFLEILKNRFKDIRSCTNPKPINKWRSDFKCKNLCHFYKQKWPGTEISMCQYTEDYIKTYGIEKASEDLKREGHKRDFYSAPGAT
jgi:hypothetical protein